MPTKLAEADRSKISKLVEPFRSGSVAVVQSNGQHTHESIWIGSEGIILPMLIGFHTTFPTYSEFGIMSAHIGDSKVRREVTFMDGGIEVTTHYLFSQKSFTVSGEKVPDYYAKIAKALNGQPKTFKTKMGKPEMSEIREILTALARDIKADPDSFNVQEVSRHSRGLDIS